MTKMNFARIRISYLKELSEKKGKFWFSPGALKFFQSKLPQFAYVKHDRYYFVSSEKGPNGIRRWSIRSMNAETAEVNTVGEFQAFGSRDSANARLAYILEHGE